MLRCLRSPVVLLVSLAVWLFYLRSDARPLWPDPPPRRAAADKLLLRKLSADSTDLVWKNLNRPSSDPKTIRTPVATLPIASASQTTVEDRPSDASFLIRARPLAPQEKPGP